jgi:hypothetical protein
MRPAPRSDLDPDEIIAQVNEVLRARLALIPLPPPNFDPLDATPHELDLYGLPPRPDPAKAAAANEAWTRLLTPPSGGKLQILPAAFPQLTSKWVTDGYRLDRTGAIQPRGRVESSRNWSGAIIAANAARPFEQIFGSWVVPAIQAPPGASDGTYRCSIWIGLDGHRGHSMSMPQLGTTQTIIVSKGVVGPISVEAWWQWWLRGQRFGPIPFNNFAVKANDIVATSLTMLGPHRVRFLITNVTTGKAAPTEIRDSPALSLPPPFPIPPVRFKLRSVAAEWITERPTYLHSDDLYLLPNFGAVTFDLCGATTRGSPFGRDLRAARLVRMVEETNNPPGVNVISGAEKDKKSHNRVKTFFCS